MNLLLTNDDGIHAEGIQALRETFEKEDDFEVHIIAPDHERSASGHAITMHRPLNVDEVRFKGSRVKAWSVNGTPADCTKLMDAILPRRPDLVISGINRGPNLGTDVFYSGTVSAALEAALLGIPAVAVSLTAFDNADFGVAAAFTLRLARALRDFDFPPSCLFNVNVPALEEEEIAGVAVTKLGIRRWKDVFDRRIDPRGKVYYWLAGEVDERGNDPDTDVEAVRNNLISVTPVQVDMTYHAMIEPLSGLVGKLTKEAER